MEQIAGLAILRRSRSVPDHIRNWTPRSLLGLSILRSLPYLPGDLAAELVERISGVTIGESSLSIRVLRGYGLFRAGLIPRQAVTVEEYGIVSRRLVTNAGVAFLVDALQNLTEPENLKFHGLGTGVTAEAVGDTALVTELTTEYNPDNTRATGTTTESAAAVYRTVATNTLDGTPAAALREHGIFSANTAGTLLDRSLFAAITLSSGDGLTTTYDYTLSAGG